VRGVRALRQAPLAVVFFLLSTCQFDLSLVDPSIDVDAHSAYQAGSNITIEYKFTADEYALRCRYTVDSVGSVVKQGLTGEFPPGTWQQLSIALDPEQAEGEYTVNLMAQALRGRDFVDLAFLTKTFEFFLDSEDPAEPGFSPAGGLFNDTVDVTLLHGEWSAPIGSPVTVYYTTDHTDPTSSSNQYIVGSPIAVQLSATPIEVRAIAIDDSGRQSSVESKTYYFLNIESIETPVETTDFEQFLHPQGYGFANINAVEFMDADGTSVSAVILDTGPSVITVAVKLDTIIVPGSIPGFQGNGTVTDGTLRLIDVSGMTDEITIDLIP
jgi:hypothetical protein